jgi:thiol:disulfide interchange protein DsbD
MLRNGLVGLLLLGALGALAQAPPPQVKFDLSLKEARSGQEVPGTLIVTFAPGYHAYQNPPSEDYMIPLEVQSASKQTIVKRVTYPPGVDAKIGGSEKPVKSYEGTVVVPVVLVAPKAEGKVELKLAVRYQQCDDDQCFAPGSVTATAALKIVPKPSPPDLDQPVSSDPNTASHPDRAAGGTIADGAGSSPSSGTGDSGTTDPAVGDGGSGAEQNSFGTPTQPGTANTAPDRSQMSWLERLQYDAFDSGNVGLMVLVAVLAGLLISITPCVYPMIPVTVTYFGNQTAGSRSAKIGLGLMYTLGIAVTYGAIGGVAAAVGGLVGELFTRPWFLFSLAVLMAALGLSMFGAYEIGIPPAISKHLKGRAGPVGALVMGLLVGVAAAPCAGALVSAFAIRVAETQNVWVGIGFFTAIGLGIGIPFMVLASVSQGAKVLPKSGGWLKTVKVFLGIVVMAFAADFMFKGLGMRSDEPRTLIAWTVFYMLAALYVALVDNSGNSRAITSLKALFALGLGVLAGMSWSDAKGPEAPGIPWIAYTPERFEEAVASGKPIVVDATADWCALCHEIENAVFKPREGVDAMKGVVPLRIDMSTGVDPKYIENARKRFDIKGLPHIIFFAPGGKQSSVVNGYQQLDTVEKLKDHLRRAGAQL